MAESQECPGCHKRIDPETCWCGDPIEYHGAYAGHTAVPIGCVCSAAATALARDDRGGADG